MFELFGGINKMVSLVSELNDSELEHLNAAVFTEQKKRAIKRFKDGKFLELDPSECSLIESGLRIEAQKQYRMRTGSSFLVAQMVVNDMAEQIKAKL